MRTLLASALLALACGCSDQSSRPSGAGATPSIPSGPDPIVLRVPRDGGTVAAFGYPALDKALWKSSSQAPALREIIAFGVEDGYLAAVDARGSAVRASLRLGAVSRSRDSMMRALTSTDGSAIYALTATGAVTRFTPSGGEAWTLRPPQPVSALFSQDDGSLIAAVVGNERVTLWRIRPPGKAVTDSLILPVGGDALSNTEMVARTAGTVGDRLFFGIHESVIAVRTLDLQKALEVDLGKPVRAVVATPSGDRLFVALEGDRTLRIVDRFEERVSGRIKLPGNPLALRMDPLGRLLLARGGGDSVFVVSLANDKVVGTLRSTWRADLPLVFVDGAVALVRDDDVIVADPEDLGDERTIEGGGRDVWHAVRWNGFRPRSKGLDAPVEFRRSAPRDTGAAPDTARDTSRALGSAPGSTEGRASGLNGRSLPQTGTLSDLPVAAEGRSSKQYTISFAALPSQREAREYANRLKVDGQSPRVTSAERNGEILYRVVMGPFGSRSQAERVGQTSRQRYWIFEGVP